MHYRIEAILRLPVLLRILLNDTHFSLIAHICKIMDINLMLNLNHIVAFTLFMNVIE